MGFLFFKSIFLRNQSLSNARWFYSKMHKIGNVSHDVQKDFKIWTLIKQSLQKYQIFMKLPQISHIHKIYNYF